MFVAVANGWLRAYEPGHSSEIDPASFDVGPPCLLEAGLTSPRGLRGGQAISHISSGGLGVHRAWPHAPTMLRTKPCAWLRRCPGRASRHGTCGVSAGFLCRRGERSLCARSLCGSPARAKSFATPCCRRAGGGGAFHSSQPQSTTIPRGRLRVPLPHRLSVVASGRPGAYHDMTPPARVTIADIADDRTRSRSALAFDVSLGTVLALGRLVLARS